MTDAATPGHDARHASGSRGRAADIYGTIVTAAVLAAGGGTLGPLRLAVLVVATLVVYWIAEIYAEVLGEEAHAGRLPGRSEIRASLAATWPMVTASFVPVLALLLAAALGMSPDAASTTALLVTLALLTWQGWAAGRSAALRGGRLFLATATAGALGVLMIVLKIVIVHH